MMKLLISKTKPWLHPGYRVNKPNIVLSKYKVVTKMLSEDMEEVKKSLNFMSEELRKVVKQQADNYKKNIETD